MVPYLVDILPRLPARTRSLMVRTLLPLDSYPFLPVAGSLLLALTGSLSASGEKILPAWARFLENLAGQGIGGTRQADRGQRTSVQSDHDYPGINAIGPVQDLKERLRTYDLVVTQFGLTAFEAAWSGCAVLLLNPSPVHEQLSHLAGFVSLGIMEPDIRTSAALAWQIPRGWLLSICKSSSRGKRKPGCPSGSLEPRNTGPCPSCGQVLGSAVFRTERKTYLRCLDCGLIRMAFFMPRQEHYDDKSYFFEEYKAQYGKTYIEDIPNIRLAGFKTPGNHRRSASWQA
jgi:hypothetical protein